MKPVTPATAIRRRCLDCANTATEARRCPFDGSRDVLCPLHGLRMGSRGSRGKGQPLRAIRAYCLWCCLESALEVRRCPSEDCPLWIYRSGRYPKGSRRAGGRPFPKRPGKA